MTVHIESKKDEIANIVLMPGDPKRFEYIAKNYLDDYKMVNDVRNMFAYTGSYKGKRITLFPSGMGIPSMGIYSYELFKEYDVDYIIRIGSCGAYDKNLKLNDIILVDYSISDSNYAKLLDNYKKNYIESNRELNNIILNTANSMNMKIFEGNIYSSETFYENVDYKKRNKKYNALGVEMETFSLFNNARLLNKKASCLLTVSDSFCYSDKLTSEDREQKLNDMIVIALESCLKL